MQKETKYVCPCCGYKTLEEGPSDTYEICSVCFWENNDNPSYEGWANQVSLNQAKENFKKYSE